MSVLRRLLQQNSQSRNPAGNVEIDLRLNTQARRPLEPLRLLRLL